MANGFKERLRTAHTAEGAYAGGAENSELDALKVEFADVLQTAKEAGDDALPHQIAKFAGFLQNDALKAKREVRTAQNLDHPQIQTAVQAFSAIKKHLDDSRKSSEEQALGQLTIARSLVGTPNTGELTAVLDNLETLIRNRHVEDQRTKYLRETVDGALQELV